MIVSLTPSLWTTSLIPSRRSFLRTHRIKHPDLPHSIPIIVTPITVPMTAHHAINALRMLSLLASMTLPATTNPKPSTLLLTPHAMMMPCNVPYVCRPHTTWLIVTSTSFSVSARSTLKNIPPPSTISLVFTNSHPSSIVRHDHPMLLC